MISTQFQWKEIAVNRVKVNLWVCSRYGVRYPQATRQSCDTQMIFKGFELVALLLPLTNQINSMSTLIRVRLIAWYNIETLQQN